jgi:hypothetical protein
MMKIQRIAAGRRPCLCRTSRKTADGRVQMPEIVSIDIKAMMLELGAVVDMKPMHCVQTTTLNVEQVLAGILVAMRIMQLENSRPRMEESKVVDVLIHKEVNVLVGTQMWWRCHMEQIMLEGMAMKRQRQRQQHSLQCKIQ